MWQNKTDKLEPQKDTHSTENFIMKFFKTRISTKKTLTTTISEIDLLIYFLQNQIPDISI
jgi:hypothetical protein